MRFNIKEMKMQGIFLGVLAVVLAAIIVVPTVIAGRPKDEPIDDTPTVSDKDEDKNTENGGTSNTEDNKNDEPTTHTHQWVSGISVEPTCTDKGYTIATCSCKESKLTNVKDPLGHKFGEWTVVAEPTTEAEGLRERKCSVCGETESEKLDKLGTGFTPDDDPNGEGGNENPGGNGGNENPGGSGNENQDPGGNGGNENPGGSGNENQGPSGNGGNENPGGNEPTE